MKWHELWTARIGDKFSQGDVDVWEDELAQEFGNLSPTEITNAVRDMGNAKRRGEIKYKPTLNHLISAIIKARYARDHGGDQANAPATRREARMDEAKREIAFAKDAISRWNLICDLGTSGDECMELEEFAETQLGFVRPTWREMGFQSYRNARTMAAGMQPRTADGRLAWQ